MSDGSWVTTIRATYDAEDVEQMRETFERVLPSDSGVTVTWEGETAVIVYDYGTSSKYGPVRPTDSALHEVFDPVADSEFYEPWPVAFELRTEWR
jgi:hypothetical protein